LKDKLLIAKDELQ